MNAFPPLLGNGDIRSHSALSTASDRRTVQQSPHHWGAFLVLGGQCVAGGAGGTSTQTIVVTLVPIHSVLLDFFVCLAFISPRKSLGWEWIHPDTQIFTDADICRHTHRRTYSHTQKHRHRHPQAHLFKGTLTERYTNTDTDRHTDTHTHTHTPDGHLVILWRIHSRDVRASSWHKANYHLNEYL